MNQPNDLRTVALDQGRDGGTCSTPEPVARLLVEMLEPYRGSVYDPCCGSGGMFVQVAAFLERHNWPADAVSFSGQEVNPPTWERARHTLALRGLHADLGPYPADTLRHDLHPGLTADFILANPPYNVRRWGGEQVRGDPRWTYGQPPADNANYAWIQHIIHHLSPRGMAAFVLPPSSLNSAGDAGSIRRAIIEDDLVDCIVALPAGLFPTTHLPVSVWVLAREKRPRGISPYRHRRAETLFIDARDLGTVRHRGLRTFTDTDIDQIAVLYRLWRSVIGSPADVHFPGFSRSATLAEIAQEGYRLSPTLYVNQRDIL